MAPVKFGLFKARSRDQPEQPSTENLLQASISTDNVSTPCSPIPSTSRGVTEDLTPADLAALQLDSDDDDVSRYEQLASERGSVHGDYKLALYEKHLQAAVNYEELNNKSSIEFNASLNDTFDSLQHYEELELSTLTLDRDDDDGATSIDANSIQFDETSIAASEDLSVYCANIKKPKKIRFREEQQLRDFDMWRASNVEVMQNLLSRSGTLDEQIKWEAIANARGLCTLTDTCSCDDCSHAKYISGMSDGDGGLGAAPLFNAISVGCQIQ